MEASPHFPDFPYFLQYEEMHHESLLEANRTKDRLRREQQSLPPVVFDAYKILESDKFEKFQWFAVLTWTGCQPNPKFCFTKDNIMKCSTFR